MNDVNPYRPHTQFDAPSATETIEAAATSRTRPSADTSTAAAAWLLPGLGCRYVGMGYDLIERFPTADRMIAAANSQLAYDVVAVCLEGSGRKYVSPRQEAQSIYVLDCAYAAVLRELGLKPSIVAGHSLGNMAAGYVTGAYDFLTGLSLVTHVEDLMEELVDGRGQAMGVVIGLDEPTVQELTRGTPDTSLANWNSPLQHVVGGSAEGVNEVLRQALVRGAKQAKRFVPERAMHTPYMDEVASRFKQYLTTIGWSEPTVPLINSHNLCLLRTSAEIGEFLGSFLARPVHWQATVQAIRQGWCDQFVEVGPGSLLTSMLPFIDSTSKIRTASDVLEARRAP